MSDIINLCNILSKPGSKLPFLPPHIIEIIFTNMLKYRTIEYIKRLYRYRSTVELDNFIRVYSENGNVEMLNEISKINDYLILRFILDNCANSKKIDLNIFIKYLKKFINLSINACFIVFHDYKNKEILKFFKELFKHTTYPSRQSSTGGIPVKYIYTLAGYDHGIDGGYIIPLEHLLATIENFSRPDIKSVENRN